MSELRRVLEVSQIDFSKLKFGEKGTGIVPVVCIDSVKMATAGLLAYRMQAFADEEALEYTLANSVAAFFSRKRNGLWVKGEESGNFLPVRATYTDRDADTLLYDVVAGDPSCHTGAETCFVTPTIGELL